MKSQYNIAFFGGEPLGLPALEHLVKAGLTPELVICNPDRRSGRGLSLTPPRIKTWSLEHDIEVFQPTSYKASNRENLGRITDHQWDLCIVVAYNFILPKWLLEIPKHGVINVHPSLLPKLRGASPIRTAILENRKDEIGVSIMLMDEEMDHGPILAQEKFELADDVWPMRGDELDVLLAEKGGEMLSATIHKWLAGEITPTEQEHLAASYTKKFDKTDAELQLDPTNLPTGDEAFKTLCKINAFAGIGDCYFMDNGKRVKVKAAGLTAGGQLELHRLTPEGKKEMDFSVYLTTR
jgi:methionyl-tRNA formyltransferase